MAVKRTRKPKEETTPIVFQVPTEFVEDIKKTRRENEAALSNNVETLKSGFTTLHASFNRHRLETQSQLLKHRKEKEDRVDGITKDLEEAFDLVWPKFRTLEDSLKEHSKKGNDALSLLDEKHIEALSTQSEIIMALIEKRYQSALKRINQQNDKIEIRTDDGEIMLVRDEVKRLELVIKEIGKYEYGSSLNIFLAGLPIGFVNQINFKSGFTVALNNSGGIDVTAQGGTGGGGAAIVETPTGVIDGTNKAYTTSQVISTVLGLWYNGEYVHPSEYTVGTNGFTMGTALPVIPGAAFTIAYQGANAIPTGTGINPQDLSSQVTGTNKVFTATGVISMVVADGAIQSFTGNYTSSYNSGTNVTTITFINAPQNGVLVF